MHVRVSGRQCKYDRFVIVCDHYRQNYSESCVGQVIHRWPGPCVILYLISRCMRPEGPAAFTNNHIPSQIDLLGPSRAPQSPSIHLARQKKRNEQNKGKGIHSAWLARAVRGWHGSAAGPEQIPPLLALLNLGNRSIRDRCRWLSIASLDNPPHHLLLGLP